VIFHHHEFDFFHHPDHRQYFPDLDSVIILFPDFDTLSIFVFQVADKQQYVKFAPPFWVAQASESPTFAYVLMQKEESLGYYQYRRCRKAQGYLPGDYYDRQKNKRFSPETHFVLKILHL